MRTKRAIKSIIASCFNRIVSLICGLAVTRLLLTYFGSEYNGAVASATQFMEYITILTIGIAGPTRVALYESLAKNDRKKTSGVLKATTIYMRKFSIAIILYSIIIMWLLPFAAHTTLPKIEISILVAIVSFSMSADYFFTVPNHTLLTADQREYVFDISSATVSLISCLLVYELIKSGYNFFIVKLVSSLILLLKPLFIAGYIRKNYTIDKGVRPDDSALKQRGDAAAISIANIIHDNIDLVLLTIAVDIKLVSVYTVYNMICKQIRAIMQMFTGSLEAGFGNIIAKGEKDSLLRNFKLYEFLMFAFVSVLFSCVFVLIIPFIENYTAGVTDINYIIPSFAILMTISEAVYCIRQPYVTLVQAAGKYKETRNGAILESVTNFVVSVVMVNLIGFQGVVIGTIVANAIRTVQYFVFIHRRIINLDLSDVIRKMIWCGSNIVVICLCAESVWKLFPMGLSWLQWILEAIIVAIIAVSFTLASALIFYRQDLNGIKQVVIRVVKN